MTKRTVQTAAPVHPLWMRWLAAACLVLMSVVATAQAVHVHGQWLPRHGSQAHAPLEAGQTAAGEDHCPLCVAMHSALPVTLHVMPLAVALYAVKLPDVASCAPESRWAFAMFSRPPPAA